MTLPDKYNAHEAEEKWLKYWEDEKVFAFDPESKDEIYSIDTPPPTVSGKMHIGHAFSYSQQDFIARYQRMIGKNVFYPFGTDDNGLATERLIEKEKKVSSKKMSRQEFVDLCLEALEDIRPKFIHDWKRIGVSADYSVYYTTINKHCQKISQQSFIDLYKKGKIYRSYAPVIFDPVLQTSIAQVEMVDQKLKSTLNFIKAKMGDSYVVYATTRPEVLYGCVGMSIAKDGTYVEIEVDGEKWFTGKESLITLTKHKIAFTVIRELKGEELVGNEVEIPIAGNKVHITHDEETKSEFGTGIVYYCTYGGSDCVEWLTRHEGVEPINVMGLDGRYNDKCGKYAGMRSPEARTAVLEDLEKEGSLIFKEKITHTVNVSERSGAEIEYVATNQWFIKYLDLKEELLAQGKQIKWFPDHMRNRYDNWVKGLKWDWNISRQRHFGIPIPVWHSKKTGEFILPDEDQLPVDPLVDIPKTLPEGHTVDDIEPEKDVLDTWATSSLTPHLAIELLEDEELKKKLFPMDLRPQAHDIITFWLFNTVVKSYFHDESIPWKNTMISGWALDPSGKKMSKSKGNVIAPQDMIEKYSADALRFWAAGSRLGDDLPFQEKDLKTGVKFVTKLWNASKFTFMQMEGYKHEEPSHLELMDKWLLSKLSKVIKFSTEAFDKYEYSHAKLETEKFFFHVFCDNYLELIKDRIYNPDKRGEEAQKAAKYTAYTAVNSVLKLMAPITPFITEELYHHFFKEAEGSKSIHLAEWPTVDTVDEEAEKAGDLFIEAVAKVRKAKSEESKSMKDPVKKVLIKGKVAEAQFKAFYDDFVATTNAQEVEFEEIAKDSELDSEIVVDLE